MADKHKLQDDSQDKRYFTIVPQLVWGYCQNTYEFTLWHTIKMIAGDNGECFLSTDDLAALSMMSAAQVSRSRSALLERGLLAGELRRDPGYPQPVWHLRIPDLWLENVEWRQNLDSLKDRIDFKNERKKTLSDRKGFSQKEGVVSQKEGVVSQKTKNNHKNIQKENQPENLDYLEDISMRVKQKAGLSVPSEFAKHFGGYRDRVLQLYHEEFGLMPNQGKKAELIEFSRSDGFDIEQFEAYVHDYNVNGGNPYDLERFLSGYWRYIAGAPIKDAMYPDTKQRGGKKKDAWEDNTVVGADGSRTLVID